MGVAFEFSAEPRTDVGKSASRRLRRNGRLPAVLYGGDRDPEALSLELEQVLRAQGQESLYSQILQLKIGSRTERVVLREIHRHPWKPVILHMDLQRIKADEKIRVHVPLHFLNEANAIGVKQQGGIVSHFKIEVEVFCLPLNLPEFIEVDLTDLELGQSIYLSQLPLPQGVELVELSHAPEHDVPVVAIHGRKGVEEEGEKEAESGEGVAS
jgi:large subunit ribosomal protein L25